MKRLWCLLLAVVLLAGCGASTGETETVLPTTEETEGSGFAEGGNYNVEDSVHYAALKALLLPKEGFSIPAVKGSSYVHSFYLGKPVHASGKAVTNLDDSVGFPFAVISGEVACDPFDNLQALKKAGYIASAQDIKEISLNEVGGGWEMILTPAALPETPKSYPYTQAGCNAFVEDVADLVRSNIGTEKLLLCGGDRSVVTVTETPEGECCGSAVIYNTSYGYAVSMYFRSHDGKTVTDVEFRLMMITYPYGNTTAGVSMNVEGTRDRFEFDAISMVWAMEYLLTGENYIVQAETESNMTGKTVSIPKSYVLGDFTGEMRGKEYWTAGEKPLSGESFYIVQFRLHT